jgi:AcrR family transcriptional regulator
MTPDDNPSRARLLKAAGDLFPRKGIGAVGVDELCRTAGVSKRSMYQLFTSKDDLVAASLEAADQRYFRHYFPEESSESPRTLILGVFEKLETSSRSATYAGCPYVSTAAEMHDPQSAPSQVSKRLKNEFTKAFRQQAELGGAADPDMLAKQLTMLFDGAIVRSAGYGEDLAGLCATTARVLLDAHGMS